MDSLICSPVSIFVFRFHLNRCHPAFLSVLGLFLELAPRLQEWRNLHCPQERGQEQEEMIPKLSLGKYPWFLLKIVFRTSQLIQQHLEICIVNVQVFHCSVHHAKISSMVLDLLHVPVSFSRNWVHKNSTSSGFVKAFLADLCTMRILSETFRRTSPTKPTVRESLPQRVETSDLDFWMHCAFLIMRPRGAERSASSSLCCGVPSSSRSSHPLRQRH